jgi:hypothetical protein
MGSGHAPGGQVTWVEVPGGRLAVEVVSSDTGPAGLIHEVMAGQVPA